MLAVSGMASAMVSQTEPSEMVQALSEELIDALNKDRAELESNPASVKVFANRYVLPYIDTAKMARYVMGRYWRTATDEQKSAFSQAFSDTLIRSYSKSLLKLNIESVNTKPAKPGKPGRVTIASVVVQADGNKTDVVYRAYFNKKTEKWMLYDVAIEGISMLLNYRKAYGSDFAKKGLDKVIEEMNAKNRIFNERSTSVEA
ncbi:MAG: ABC transporter substrate-binding protein [Gammaproteobacteria bacterium]|nr:ABC transporter substrate-binding protein [Gammaproteobacteria bacterium]